MLKPAWCPNVLCPAPQPVLDPNGVHDQNLEVSLTTVQSSNFVLANNPNQYSAKSLHTHIGAVRIDKLATDPYRVVLRVHSLQQGEYGMYIEGTSLIVDKILVSPQPLNIWYVGNTLDYRSNIYTLKYSGQSEGEVIYGSYTSTPGGFVQLAPGESDDLDLEVVSNFPVTLLFRAQVMYRAYNENATHTLTLPTEFEVVISDKTNWHPYILDNNHLVPFP